MNQTYLQVHKDHAFAENPMEREDEEVVVKLEGENVEALKEVRSCFCPVSGKNDFFRLEASMKR